MPSPKMKLTSLTLHFEYDGRKQLLDFTSDKEITLNDFWDIIERTGNAVDVLVAGNPDAEGDTADTGTYH